MRLCAGHAADNGIIRNIIRYYYTFGFGTIADVCAAAVVTAVSTNRRCGIVPPSGVQDDAFTITPCSKHSVLKSKFSILHSSTGGGMTRPRGWFVVYLVRVDNAFTGYWKITENVLKLRGAKLDIFISHSLCRFGLPNSCNKRFIPYQYFHFSVKKNTLDYLHPTIIFTKV